ncbi:hypothetical protein BO78DRAFT_394813 [Aspergillus sclerotiicarbonarius CBS 121057]|uniref:Uncharacterized protein n=1 Tax=Aspergillus sclerotiicarbonarius (strain CBS 121057 / IBT 28362) TaxID=1448318 RepID=A0A319F2N4_ASPSB|nr:hypothetical protein BO78DRAFT_394813 [Aspergillus sclerotiicarbonarius CBS 121057]
MTPARARLAPSGQFGLWMGVVHLSCAPRPGITLWFKWVSNSAGRSILDRWFLGSEKLRGNWPSLPVPCRIRVFQRQTFNDLQRGSRCWRGGLSAVLG